MSRNADCTQADMSSNGTRHKSDVVMLVIDVINHFEFNDGSSLLKEALRIAPNIARLKARARRSNIPVLYVNDNFGQWRSDARKLLGYCLRTEARGREFVEWVRPDEDDYFVLKPMHSAFYQSPLELLLRNFGSSTLVIAGLATDSCILTTAHDADMRQLNLVVPADCCASRSPQTHRRALEHIRTLRHASVVQSSSIRFPRPKRQA
jgi:nicotinamidase-related amidase